MPEIIPNGNTVKYGPNFILERPELAAQAANVCSNWALVEDDLTTLYALLMGTYLPRAAGFSPPIHPVAIQVFDALNSLAPRLDLLLRLFKWRASKDQCELLERTLIPIMKRKFKERSVVAHGVWGLCDKYADSLILQRAFGGDEIWRKHDFVQISERIVELHGQMGALIKEIHDDLKKK
jgi:hypothetical protein